MATQFQSDPSDFNIVKTTFPLAAYQRIFVLLNTGQILDANALLQEFDLIPEEFDQPFAWFKRNLLKQPA